MVSLFDLMEAMLGTIDHRDMAPSQHQRAPPLDARAERLRACQQNRRAVLLLDAAAPNSSPMPPAANADTFSDMHVYGHSPAANLQALQRPSPSFSSSSSSRSVSTTIVLGGDGTREQITTETWRAADGQVRRRVTRSGPSGVVVEED